MWDNSQFISVKFETVFLSTPVPIYRVQNVKGELIISSNVDLEFKDHINANPPPHRYWLSLTLIYKEVMSILYFY